MPTAHQCNKAFDDAEREFGDRSTEFLASIAADRLGCSYSDIIDGIAQVAQECGEKSLPFGYSDDKA